MEVNLNFRCCPKFPERHAQTFDQIKHFLEQENFAKTCIVGDQDFGRKIWFRLIRNDGLESLPRVIPEYSLRDFDFQNELKKLSKSVDKS